MSDQAIKLTDTRREIRIGVWDTKNAESVQFDVKAWTERWPTGQLHIIVQRPEECNPYEAAHVTVEDGIATWVFDEVDTGVPGVGSCALLFSVGQSVRARTPKFTTQIATTLLEAGPTTPNPLRPWVDRLVAQVADLTADAEAAAATAASSASAAGGAAEDAEAYAVGKRNGEDVDDQDPAYHNNSKYYAAEASGSASAASDAKNDAVAAKGAAQGAQTAAESARDAAAKWATGGTSGTPSATNNAKKYAEDAAGSASAASDSASAASESAGNAEAWAVGQRNGTNVPPTDPAYENNAKHYAAATATLFAAAGLSVVDGKLCLTYKRTIHV